MIKGVSVVEYSQDDGNETTIGVFDFLALPRLHEMVVLPRNFGDLAWYEVTVVQHSPVPSAPTGPEERWLLQRGPSVVVYVSWFRDLDV